MSKNALRIEPTSVSTGEMTQRQAAKYLGVAYGTLTLWVARGRLPFRLVAGLPIFAKADLDRVDRPKKGRPRNVVPIKQAKKSRKK